MNNLSIEQVSELRLAIEAAQTVTEAQKFLETARMWAAAAKESRDASEQMRIAIAEQEARAERRMGELLKLAKDAGQISKGGHGNQYTEKCHVPDENMAKITLSEAGITRKLSMRSQQLAGISKEEFEQVIADARDTGKASNLTIPKILKAVKPTEARDEEIIARSDAGESVKEIQADMGVSAAMVSNARRKAKAERRGAEKALGEIDPSTLSLSAQEKLVRVIEQEKRRLMAGFDEIVREKVKEETRDAFLRFQEAIKKEREEAKLVYNQREGFMTKKVFRLIVSCLHPDKFEQIASLIREGNTEELERLRGKTSDAFRMFNQLEKCILNEKESPTIFSPPIPRTPAEWKAWRNRGKRSANGSKTVATAS